MQIQQGVVRYKDRTDLICNYGITDDGKQYYFLDDKPLSNGNIIASTALVEAVDTTVKASHAGVITKDGQIVIPLENKMVKNLGNNILLVERATPVSKTVLESIGLKNIPDAATKLVTTPAAIKDRLMVKMQNEGRFVFNDQFSEATIFDYDGRNLIDNEYFSFIGMNSKKIYFSKNTVDSEIVEYSIFPEKVAVENNNKDQINVQEIAKNNEEKIAETINGQMAPQPVVNNAVNGAVEGKHVAGGVMPPIPSVPPVQNMPVTNVPVQQPSTTLPPTSTGVVPEVPFSKTLTSQNAGTPIIPVVSEMQGAVGVPATVGEVSVVPSTVSSEEKKEEVVAEVKEETPISPVKDEEVKVVEADNKEMSLQEEVPAPTSNEAEKSDDTSIEAVPIAPEETNEETEETSLENAPIEAIPIAPEDVEDTVMANKKEEDSDTPSVDEQIPVVDIDDIPAIPKVDIEEDESTEKNLSEANVEDEEVKADADDDAFEKLKKEASQLLNVSKIKEEADKKKAKETEEIEETDEEEKEEALENEEEDTISTTEIEDDIVEDEDYNDKFDVSLDDDFDRDSRDDMIEDRFNDSFEDRDDFSDRDLFGDSLLNLDRISTDYDESRSSTDMNIIDDVTKSMANLINLNKKQSNKIVDYEKAVARLRRSGNEISKKNRSLEEEIRFLNGKVRNYETIVSKLENRNRELDDRIQEQNKRLKDQEEEIQSLKPSASSKEELLKLIADANSLLDDDIGFRRTA